MAEVIKLPALNPLQFHKVPGGNFACDELPSFEEDKIYMQKFIRNVDEVYFQVHVHEDYIAAIGFYIESLTGETLPLTGSSLGVLNGFQIWHIYSDNFWTLVDGVYFVVLEVTINMGAGEVTKKYVSEPVQMVSELPESLLIEYSHIRNEYDMAFYPDGELTSKLTYYLRVEGGIPSDGFIPGSKDAYFIDQGRDVNLLDSTPYNVYKFTFGPKQGIPNWLANKINRILSLQEIVINDIQYTKNDGAKFEPIREKEYPLAGWQIELVKVESEDSFVEDEAVATPTEGLELTFDSIANVPVADATSVTDWNTFFDLPTNGTPFTSVYVDGDVVTLIGVSFSIADYIFQNNTHLLKVIDTNAIQYGSIYTFDGCVNLTEIILPVVNNVGRYTFRNCSSLELLSIPNCTTLGDDEDSNNVFTGISGQSITLTVSSYLMTIFGGNPDGDIQYLQANNTVTIVTV